VGKLKVVKINADEHTELVNKLGVHSIPTILYYKDGALVRRSVGVTDQATITAVVASL